MTPRDPVVASGWPPGPEVDHRHRSTGEPERGRHVPQGMAGDAPAVAAPPEAPPDASRRPGWRENVDRLREAARIALRLRATAPDWVLALAIFVASRLFDGFLIARNAALAGRHPDGTPYSYLYILPNWDGTWYQAIIRHGYPDQLPLDATGHVAQNAWAFYPLFPTLVGGLIDVTGWSFAFAASVVSIGAGALAAVGMQKLVAAVAGRRLALGRSSSSASSPPAPCCNCRTPSRWRSRCSSASCSACNAGTTCSPCRSSCWPVSPGPSPSRSRSPCSCTGCACWSGGPAAAMRCPGARWPPSSRWRLASVAAAVAWPLVVAIRTGRLDAYTQTMASWRNPRQVVPFLPWRDAAERFLGFLGMPVLVVAVVALAVWILRPRAGVIAGDMRVWCLAYAATCSPRWTRSRACRAISCRSSRSERCSPTSPGSGPTGWPSPSRSPPDR